MAIDRGWHAAHRLSPRATMDERVRWHVEHARVCGCRPIPEAVLDEIRRRGLDPGR